MTTYAQRGKYIDERGSLGQGLTDPIARQHGLWAPGCSLIQNETRKWVGMCSVIFGRSLTAVGRWRTAVGGHRRWLGCCFGRFLRAPPRARKKKKDGVISAQADSWGQMPTEPLERERPQANLPFANVEDCAKSAALLESLV